MTLRFTEEEYREWLANRKRKQAGTTAQQAVPAAGAAASSLPDAGAKRSKYGNHRVEIDGKKFDSKHEARVYEELMARVRAGELRTVCRQVSFDLPGNIRYVADFVTIAPDMSIEGVYDAKSAITRKNRVYINKRKQMEACWGITIKEV
ncbi:MAG: DUF1064 domain-containing protein [Clostridia bacterium]|nr:DUF1064 domain-containing protein [Clostridia bacterium]